MAKLLMPKASAVWLIENTTLTFDQIAGFCNLHHIEVQALADGEIEGALQSLSPIINNQVTLEEIRKCEADPSARLKINEMSLPDVERSTKRRATYIPVSKRNEKPDAIAWCITNHPELTDAQLRKLIGTTKNTINKIRERSHWNIANLRPRSPSDLGLCHYTDLHREITIGQQRVKSTQETVVETELPADETPS